MTAIDGRPLTDGEAELVASMFGDAIDRDRILIHRRRWLPFQPPHVIMAPDGHMWVPPSSPLWCDDYGAANLPLQGLFLHEMTHVLQAQQRGRWYLPLMRHPFCRYSYRFDPGRPFGRYGLEQQAEIVRHVFLMRRGVVPAGAPPLPLLEGLLPFGPRASA